MTTLFIRPRRLRAHPVLRSMTREVTLRPEMLIYPLFIKGRSGPRIPVISMPGIDQIPLEALPQEIHELQQVGISSVILFGIPSYKDAHGSAAYDEKGMIPEAIRCIHEVAPEMLVISDLCFCEYTDHGHCGMLDPSGYLDNDATLEGLVRQALCHAKAGVDVIAPSGMIDGMVGALRRGLDAAGFTKLPIMSYSVKYASSFYAPFRDAAEGAPQFGDRSSYQMDPANGSEALKEVALDIQEGADFLMVKPAHTYLDVIYRVKQAYPHIPLGAYHVSGEFAMLKAAAARGWVDEKRAVFEVLHGIRRAGADFIISYYAKAVAAWLGTA